MMTEESRYDGAIETVLVVDEDALCRHVLEEALEQRGYHVIAAENGASAVAAVERANPAATLLDLGARGSEGIETLRALRRSGYEGVVIVLTANGTLKTAREAMVLGAHDYVTKPYRLEHLQHLLREGLDDEAIRRETRVCAH